jgi:hypothetical protein
MGYFGVLHTGDTLRCEILLCHINLWCLPSLFPSRRLLYFDLGLQIRAGNTEPVKAVEVLLPFRVEHGSWPDGEQVAHDLYDYMSSEDVAELVFGGPVSQSQTERDQRILRIGAQQEELWLVRINSEEVKPVPGYAQRSDSSLYLVSTIGGTSLRNQVIVAVARLPRYLRTTRFGCT